ncbi:hypothetical protein [Gottfriedia acidiceleris]|uniref:hypothetical protein n=1 Tax=Gottfriedia acidiceleris TaxID=371036 RepID=UPI003D1FB271
MEIKITELSNVIFNDLIIGPVEDGKVSIGINKNNKIIKIPIIGNQIIHLLRHGNNIKETALILGNESLNTNDVEVFVKQLCELGFVARVDNIVVNEIESIASKIMKANNFGFVKNPITLSLLVFFTLLTFLNLINNFNAIRVDSLFWSGYTFVSLITYQLISWIILFLHEYGHVFAAKLVGIESNLRIKINGPFITVYTVFELLWSRTRGERIFTYLGGVIIEILILGISSIIYSFSNSILIVTPLKIVITVCILGFLSQIQLLFKTDMYLIIKEIAKKDIYLSFSDFKKTILNRNLKERIDLITSISIILHTIAFISRFLISLYIISLVYYFSYCEITQGFQQKYQWHLLSGLCSVIIQTILLFPFIKSVVLRVFKDKKKNIGNKRSLYDSVN